MRNGAGGFSQNGTYYVYEIVGSSSVNFTVDSVLPTISLASAQNKTYDSANVVINLTLNKPVSKIIYSLDNQGNLTSNSNVALVLDNLGNGEHIATVYAQDEYGLVSAPSTIYFTVKVSPTISILTVSTIAVIIAVAVSGLVFYLKKNKRSGS